MTEIATEIVQADDPRTAARVAALIRGGGVVALPTETVYGVMADATNEAAVERVFDAKGRPESRPLPVMVSCRHMVEPLVADGWDRTALDLLSETFWPGPLTVIVPRAETVLDRIVAGGKTVAIRIPQHGSTLATLMQAGVAVVAPSANRSDEVAATSADAVLSELGGRVDLIVDGGPSEVGIESTIVTLAESSPRILRSGAISATRLSEVLGCEVSVPVAPSAHEGGAGALRLVRQVDARCDNELGRRALVVLVGPAPSGAGAYGEVYTLSPNGDAAEAGRLLYSTLREATAHKEAVDVWAPAGDDPALSVLLERARRYAATS